MEGLIYREGYAKQHLKNESLQRQLNLRSTDLLKKKFFLKKYFKIGYCVLIKKKKNIIKLIIFHNTK